MGVYFKNFNENLTLPNSESLYNENFDEYIYNLLSIEENKDKTFTYFIVIDNWNSYHYYKIENNKVVNKGMFYLLAVKEQEAINIENEIGKDSHVVEIRVFDSNGEGYDI